MSSLKRHKESKHEGIRYPCDQCGYAATTVSNLKQHKESKHEGIRSMWRFCHKSQSIEDSCT